VHVNGEPVAQLETSGITYLHTDHLATPRKATNEAGQVVWEWDSEAFGNEAPMSYDGTEVNLRFPGQVYDVETGLYYNYFRYYDPGTGRYITSDPIGLDGGLNTYAYVEGNPVNFIDPTGLAAGDKKCQSGYCKSGGTHGTTGMFCIGGKNVCRDCAVKLLGIGGMSGGQQTKILQPFIK
ncbi:MAG: hypothetical protein GY820_37095, partial [Gammaproteobacteria bacterium]|nr:hypothetical protein [Gammaproteobacteria bacterium]